MEKFQYQARDAWADTAGLNRSHITGYLSMSSVNDST